MAFLICRFASSRSEPERIRRWIAYLEDMRRTNPEATEQASLIERLLSDAHEWLGACSSGNDGKGRRGVIPARGAAVQ